jgi:AcrR family transcriptional regulator
MSKKPQASTTKAPPAPRRGRPRSDGRAPISREDILKATWATLEKKSIAATSVKDVATELGCHTASIFYHFPTKSALIEAVAMAAFTRELKWIKKIVELDAPADVTLFRVVHDDAYYVGSGAPHVRSIFLSPELRNGACKELDLLMQEYEERLLSIIEAGMAAGLLKTFDVEFAKDCLNALGMVGAVRWNDAPPGKARQLALVAARMGVGGLLANSSRLDEVEHAALSLRVTREELTV